MEDRWFGLGDRGRYAGMTTTVYSPCTRQVEVEVIDNPYAAPQAPPNEHVGRPPARAVVGCCWLPYWLCRLCRDLHVHCFAAHSPSPTNASMANNYCPAGAFHRVRNPHSKCCHRTPDLLTWCQRRQSHVRRTSKLGWGRHPYLGADCRGPISSVATHRHQFAPISEKL